MRGVFQRVSSPEAVKKRLLRREPWCGIETGEAARAAGRLRFETGLPEPGEELLDPPFLRFACLFLNLGVPEFLALVIHAHLAAFGPFLRLQHFELQTRNRPAAVPAVGGQGDHLIRSEMFLRWASDWAMPNSSS